MFRTCADVFVFAGRHILTASLKREFCRKLYRSGQTKAARTAWLDAISDEACKQQSSGRSVLSVASAGTSTQFQFFDGWSPADALALVDAARAWVLEDTSTVDDALALVPAGVTSFGHNFSSACNHL